MDIAILDDAGSLQNVIVADSAAEVQATLPEGWVATVDIPRPAPPPPPPPHIVTGAEFLALFTPAEIAALWGADPRLMAGALKVAAQDSCNLDSPECAQLMALAVAKGALAAGRVVDVLAGRAAATA